MAGVVQVGNGVGASVEWVEASEASEKYKFYNLLSWWVLSMQRMYKDAEGRRGDGWGRVRIALMGVEGGRKGMMGRVLAGDVSGGWPWRVVCGGVGCLRFRRLWTVSIFGGVLQSGALQKNRFQLKTGAGVFRSCCLAHII